MKTIKKTAISFLATLVLWMLFSWPLPKYLFSGVPSLAHPSSVDVQVMTAGDHLQFMYHCRLVGDMLAGRVPWFHNLYEFNTGDDGERFQVEPYYVPFSIIYALGAWMGGAAFGWNLTGFLSLWLTFLFTWLLAARYASSDWIACCAAAVSIALPYRWISLLGGSPTGFAMMWAPMALLGIDMAVREERVRGGFLAGVAILFASWTDMHVFFFTALALPPWCAVALLRRGPPGKSWPAAARGVFFALLPAVALAVAAVLAPRLMQWLTSLKTGLAPAADMVATRTLDEVGLYSPGWQGLFTWHELRRWGEIYAGFSALAILLAGGLTLAVSAVRDWRKNRRVFAVLLALLLGMILIVFLALGTNGPWDALFLRACRKFIPPYGMIRQTLKIYCLMPSFLSVLLALSLSALTGLLRAGALRAMAAGLCSLLVVAEYGVRIHPHICLLEEKQSAYDAAVARAEETGAPARALIIPLWPGDSHFASVYQHYAAVHRLRMLNGYTPFVKRDYFDNIFLRFESVNEGYLSDEQADALLEMGVGAVIVHEDLFPEKVSPFPVTFTLRQLMNNPRLALLEQDGSVWAFEILTGPVEKTEMADWRIFGSARRWEAESCCGVNAAARQDPRAHGGAFVRLEERGARISSGVQELGGADDIKWMVRVRGEGALAAEQARGASIAARLDISVRSADWTWLTIPVEEHETYEPRSISIELIKGVLDVDTILIVAGEWGSPEPGHELRVPAPAFFHAGYINRVRNSVALEKDRHANVFVFYGPKLPLEKGIYEVELVFRTDAPAGTPLGWFNVRRRTDDPERRNEVISGARAVATLNHPENLVVNVEFVLFRNADVEIDEVVFRRLERGRP